MDFKGQKVGGLWRPVVTGVLAPKEEVSKLGGSNIRVLEARGLAGLAGRRMEQRSLARSMLWRDRRINQNHSLLNHNIVKQLNN